MLHLREYYERALREFGSTGSGKRVLFIYSFIPCCCFYFHPFQKLAVLPLWLLLCRVEPISSVLLSAWHCSDPSLWAQGRCSQWDGFSGTTSKQFWLWLAGRWYHLEFGFANTMGLCFSNQDFCSIPFQKVNSSIIAALFLRHQCSTGNRTRALVLKGRGL